METFTIPLIGHATQNNGLTYVHKVLSNTIAALGTVQLVAPASVDNWVTEFTLVLNAETVVCTGSVDGTNFSAALAPIDQSTGRPASSTNLASGTYTVPVQWPFQQLKFLKSAAVNQGVVSVLQINVPE